MASKSNEEKNSLNINRSVSDAYYRYKMPKLVTKVEGKGNGVKTVIVNMTDIGKALGRPPSYPIKYFGSTLGVQTMLKDRRFIVNGIHEASKLQDALDGFIKKFVLCPQCMNPETVLSVSLVVTQSCKACGFSGAIHHKINNYILKNPPSDKKR